MPLRILLCGTACAGALTLLDTRIAGFAFIVAILVWFASLTFSDPAR